jgi:ligand-binding sensor domain-containing protein/signal transduction histidine kinase
MRPREFLVIILQLAYVPAPALAARLPLRHYTTVDGLPHNRVNQMIRDSSGFLWLCTPNGLSQFDGTTFVTYDADRELCRSIYEDPRGGFYWVVAGGYAIYRFDPKTDDRDRVLTRYTAAEDAEAAGVDIVLRDRSGTMWAAGSRGLFVVEAHGDSGTLRPIELPRTSPQSPLRRLWRLLEDRSGALWIGSSGGLWRRTPDGRLARRPVRPGNPGTLVMALMEDPEGRIWVGHEDGVTIFVPNPLEERIDPHGVIEGVRFTRRASDRNAGRVNLPSVPGETLLLTHSDGLGRGLVTSLLSGADGRIWVGTIEGELTVFDNKAFRTYTTAEGISPRIVSLAEDYEGNLWIGSQVGGAARLARNGFTSYGSADGLTDIRPLIVDSSTGDAVLLSGRQLWAFDGQRFSPVAIDLPIRDMPPVLRDRRGEWWIGTSKGIYRFAAVKNLRELVSARPRAVYDSADGLPAGGVGSMCEDGEGDIWVTAGAGDALARWGRVTNRILAWSYPSGAAVKGRIVSCGTDRDGGVWLALAGRVVRFKAGRFTQFTEADGVPRAGLSGLILDRRGRLWVSYARGVGLLRCDDPTVEHPRFARYTTREGLTSPVIWALAEDSFGRIYLGTKDGVDRIDPDTGRVRNYTSEDGLGNEEIADIFPDAQGVLWFTALQSVATLKPLPDPTTLPLPPVRITSVRAGGIERPVPPLGRRSIEAIELPQAHSQLEIAFAGISFGLEGKLRFQYRLEGIDRDWSAPTDVHTVNYQRLPAGGYQFQVRAVTAEGASSPQPAIVSFTILPPVWMRWWFIALSVLAVAAAVLVAHRARVARLLAVERVRTRLAMDLHDDVGSGLSQIAVLSEVAREEASQAGKELVGPLSRIADVSREMVDNMSDIVWATNPDRDHMVDLVQRMRRFASDQLAARGIDLRFTGPDTEQSIGLDPDLRRQIYLIFKEAVNNAARHSRCRRVEIALEVRHRSIELRVSDDGMGLAPEGRGEGQGMSSMSRRASALKGSLRTVSKAGEGTTLTLVVPFAPGPRLRGIHLSR